MGKSEKILRAKRAENFLDSYLKIDQINSLLIVGQKWIDVSATIWAERNPYKISEEFLGVSFCSLIQALAPTFH